MLFEDKNRSLFYTCSTAGALVQVTAFAMPAIELVVMNDYCGLNVNSADDRLRIDGS